MVNKPAKADEAEAYEANNARPYEADAKVDEADKAIVSNEIKVSVIGKIDAADEAIVISKVIVVDEADESDKAIVADDANDAVLYSLTKYSAIFAEVQEYFRITASDNQLGQRSLCSLRSNSWYQLDNQLEIVVEKRLV